MYQSCILISYKRYALRETLPSEQASSMLSDNKVSAGSPQEVRAPPDRWEPGNPSKFNVCCNAFGLTTSVRGDASLLSKGTLPGKFKLHFVIHVFIKEPRDTGAQADSVWVRSLWLGHR